MFARPKKVAPGPKLSEVDRSFTKYAIPLISRSSIGSPKVGFVDDNSSKATAEDSTIESNEKTITLKPQPVPRSGDYRSYNFTAQNDKNQAFFIDKKSARRMYRVLIVKETALGKKILIDSLDGKIYCDGFTYRNRVARDIVLFDSKSAALSERYPSNQVLLDPRSCFATSILI